MGWRGGSALAFVALLAAASACGARSDLYLYDTALGADSGTVSPTRDATLDSAPDVALSDVVSRRDVTVRDGGLLDASRDAVPTDVVLDAMRDAMQDVTVDSAPEAGDAGPLCAPGGPGLTNCGIDANDNCCTSLEVLGGTSFYRTYGNDGGGPTGEADPATLSRFRLDKYLVTVGRFRQFVNAVYPDGGVPAPDAGPAWTPAEGSGKHSHLNAGRGLSAAPNVDAGQTYEPGWVASDDTNIAPTNGNLACSASYGTWTSTPGGQESLPINCVNWWESYAFCIWDGGFLPSDAEWEYAAAGGSLQREYPWGATPPGKADQYAIYGCLFPAGADGGCSGLANIAPVGTAALGAGLWGHEDMAGELSEWNLDWGAPEYADPCVDCANLTMSGSGRVLRSGGYFVTAAPTIRPPAHPDQNFPGARFLGVGVRCARPP